VRVRGRDVTRRAVVTPYHLLLPRGLVPPGRSVIRLGLADRAGNDRAVRWKVDQPGR
jgi:hypothetical protein